MLIWIPFALAAELEALTPFEFALYLGRWQAAEITPPRLKPQMLHRASLTPSALAALDAMESGDRPWPLIVRQHAAHGYLQGVCRGLGFSERGLPRPQDFEIDAELSPTVLRSFAQTWRSAPPRRPKHLTHYRRQAMPQKKQLDATRGFEPHMITDLLARLPAALARLTEERNRSRLSALRESSGVILQEVKHAGQTAALLLADVLGLEVEFDEGQRRGLDQSAELATLKSLLGLPNGDAEV